VNLLWYYLAAINLALFLAMGYDKGAALRHRRRVPEATLFALALPGGSLGGLCGMLLFHHKIRKKKFLFGFPLIFVLQAILVGCILFK